MSGKSGDVKKGDPVVVRDATGSQSRHSSEEARENGWSEGRQEDECVRTDRMETQEERVPETAGPPSETRARWAWAEPSVWTERMLDALDNGIRGDKETKWFCLIISGGQIVSLKNSGCSRCTQPGGWSPVL